MHMRETDCVCTLLVWIERLARVWTLQPGCLTRFVVLPFGRIGTSVCIRPCHWTAVGCDKCVWTLFAVYIIGVSFSCEVQAEEVCWQINCLLFAGAASSEQKHVQAIQEASAKGGRGEGEAEEGIIRFPKGEWDALSRFWTRLLCYCWTQPFWMDDKWLMSGINASLVEPLTRGVSSPTACICGRWTLKSYLCLTILMSHRDRDPVEFMLRPFFPSVSLH